MAAIFSLLFTILLELNKFAHYQDYALNKKKRLLAFIWPNEPRIRLSRKWGTVALI